MGNEKPNERDDLKPIKITAGPYLADYKASTDGAFRDVVIDVVAGGSALVRSTQYAEALDLHAVAEFSIQGELWEIDVRVESDAGPQDGVLRIVQPENINVYSARNGRPIPATASMSFRGSGTGILRGKIEVPEPIEGCEKARIEAGFMTIKEVLELSRPVCRWGGGAVSVDEE